MSLLHLRQVELNAGQLRLQLDLKLHSPVTGLFGPSGAGKTLALEMIAGLRRPHQGRIQLSEEVLFDSETHLFVPPENRRIGYVPQDLALFPHKTVEQNLRFGSSGPHENGDKFLEIILTLGLESLLQRYPQNLSGGEKQRVAIGRALMTNPKLLLLDEPLANLDSELKHKLRGLFKRLNEEFRVPFLYVTHDPNEIAALCDEVVLIEAGRIKGQGKFDEFFQPSSEPLFRMVRE